jgi:hypothetical protein
MGTISSWRTDNHLLADRDCVPRKEPHAQARTADSSRRYRGVQVLHQVEYELVMTTVATQGA